MRGMIAAMGRQGFGTLLVYNLKDKDDLSTVHLLLQQNPDQARNQSLSPLAMLLLCLLLAALPASPQPAV